MVYRVNRRLTQWLDQLCLVVLKKITCHRLSCPSALDNPKICLITVNYSTTYYLKLMLLTLTQQSGLDLLGRIVVVDNHSRDGGLEFARNLVDKTPGISLVENHFFLNHARGIRSGVAQVDRLEHGLPDDQRCNILLFCDTDIVFRSVDTLQAIADVFVQKQAAVAGELRYHLYEYPEAQASFLAIRRDVYARCDITPWVNHGAPAYWLQRSIWRAGLPVVDFPANKAGYILHKGRSGVRAASVYYPGSSYSTVKNNKAHYMGIPNGDAIWRSIEDSWASVLSYDDDRLVAFLSSRFSFGTPLSDA